MRKLTYHFTNPYRDTHTVFRHDYKNGDASAQFAVRRVFQGQPEEVTQMETSIDRRHRTRTTSQHMSVIMTPAEAREFALAVAPELEALHQALLAEQEWRDREAAGALDPEWSYEDMVGDKRRQALLLMKR